MTNTEAIETLRVNYPDACYEQLREAVDAAIEALKAQDTAGDTISRQAALDAVAKVHNTDIRYARVIDKLPSAEVRRNTGKWKYTMHYGQRYMVCKFCNAERKDDHSTGWNFCPNCGAQMER